MPDTQLWNLLDAGRHALDEDAVATPIFSALTRGGWRRRQREVQAVEQFRSDPLTAPLPVVTAVSAVPPAREGRHHRRRERMDTFAWGISA